MSFNRKWVKKSDLEYKGFVLQVSFESSGSEAKGKSHH